MGSVAVYGERWRQTLSDVRGQRVMAVNDPDATSDLYDLDGKVFTVAKLSRLLLDAFGANAILRRVKFEWIAGLHALGSVR